MCCRRGNGGRTFTGKRWWKAITDYVEAHGQIKKRRTMLFSDDEKELIEGNEMLTDESINLAISLIHEQFPHIGGLTDSSIGKCQ